MGGWVVVVPVPEAVGLTFGPWPEPGRGASVLVGQAEDLFGRGVTLWPTPSSFCEQWREVATVEYWRWLPVESILDGPPSGSCSVPDGRDVGRRRPAVCRPRVS